MRLDDPHLRVEEAPPEPAGDFVAVEVAFVARIGAGGQVAVDLGVGPGDKGKQLLGVVIELIDSGGGTVDREMLDNDRVHEPKATRGVRQF